MSYTQFLNDYNAGWDMASTGQQKQGNLNWTSNNANWTNPDTGNTFSWSKSEDPFKVYERAPQQFKNTWDEAYGADAFKIPLQQQQWQQDLLSKIPQSNSTSANVSNSQSQSYSGLPQSTITPFLENIMPLLNTTISSLPATIDKYTNNAAKLYGQMGGQMLNQQMPDYLNALNRRGILDSTITSDALRGLGRDISDYTGNKVYEAGMNAAQMAANIPSVLGQLATLGQSSQSSGTSTGFGGSNSTTTDPLAPYYLLNSLALTNGTDSTTGATDTTTTDTTNTTPWSPTGGDGYGAFETDLLNFLNSAASGQSYDWLGGSILNNPGDLMTYTGPNGQVNTFGDNATLDEILGLPGVQDWASGQYNFNPAAAAPATPQAVLPTEYQNLVDENGEPIPISQQDYNMIQAAGASDFGDYADSIYEANGYEGYMALPENIRRAAEAKIPEFKIMTHIDGTKKTDGQPVYNDTVKGIIEPGEYFLAYDYLEDYMEQNDMDALKYAKLPFDLRLAAYSDAVRFGEPEFWKTGLEFKNTGSWNDISDSVEASEAQNYNYGQYIGA